MSQNDTADVSDTTLREAFKAVMCGHIISYEATMAKCRQRRLLEIEAQLPVLERDHMEVPLSSKLNYIIKLKYEYISLLSNQVNTMLLKIKQKHFELYDKPDKLLASQLRGIQANRAIQIMKSCTGAVTTDPK
jgi:hypothetical protein